MPIVIARYRAFMSDNYQGASGKPYEDEVKFYFASGETIEAVFENVDVMISKRVKEVSELTMCGDDNKYQLISVNVSE
jgi:hypothetical protein